MNPLGVLVIGASVGGLAVAETLRRDVVVVAIGSHPALDWLADIHFKAPASIEIAREMGYVSIDDTPRPADAAARHRLLRTGAGR